MIRWYGESGYDLDRGELLVLAVRLLELRASIDHFMEGEM